MEKDPLKFGRDTFVGKTNKSLNENYEVVKQLGKGGYGKVYRVRNKITGKMFACKKLSKLDIANKVKFDREINILIKTDHPNIIKLYEVFESKNSYYLIMEECHGGELFNRIMEHIESGEMYSEKEAAEIIQQVMSAIEYCHNNEIVHRDLKPENLLYLKKGEEKNNPLKVIDFGLSRTLDSKVLSSKVGTAYYVSPEILAGEYTEKCDIWSAGVILYILLSGEPPFNGPSDGVIYSKIKKMDLSYPPKRWELISNEAKDLLSHMLTKENERYSASQVLAHPWFKIAQEKKSLEKLNFTTKFFKDYLKNNQLKKVVLVFVASRLQDNEINDLKEIFQAFDDDNDGQINYKEFEQGLLKLNSKKIKPEEINSYFSSIDTDKNGKIDYTEFIAACMQKKIILTEERLYEAFSMLDTDRNGKITKDEIMNVLKLQSGDDQFVKGLMEKADKNNDGVIDYTEFLEFMGFKK